jgi:hypothetical protein
MAKLMADHRGRWNGTLLTLFQPAEETGDGAQGMVDDGLFKRIPAPDVALAQHVLPGIAGTVSTRSGPFMSAADCIKVTVYGRGGHGSMPQHTVDPVVLAAMIIVRLQTIVSREVAPGDTAVLTVGSCRAGTRSNVIPDSAVLELNMRSYSPQTRERMLAAIQRIVRAECQASGSPRDPEFETLFRPADRQRGLQQDPRRRGRPVHLLGRRVLRSGDLPRRGEGREARRPPHEPLSEIPAPAAAHPANRHRGPDRRRPGLARAALTTGRAAQSFLEKIRRKNRKTFSMSRKIDAASKGAALMP